MSTPISRRIMTDGINHIVYSKISPSANWWFENAYYDFERMSRFTLRKDGTLDVTNSTNILKHRGVKDWDWVWFGGADWGETKGTYNYRIRGGMYMTSSRGQGTKYYSYNAEYLGSIDKFVDLLGGMGSTGFVKKNPKISITETLEFLKRMLDAGGHRDDIADGLQEMIRIYEGKAPAQTETGLGASVEATGAWSNDADTIITTFTFVQEPGSSFSRTVETKKTVKKSELIKSE